MSISILRFISIVLVSLLVSCGRKAADHPAVAPSKTERAASDTKGELVVKPLPGMDQTVDLKLDEGNRTKANDLQPANSHDPVQSIESGFEVDSQGVIIDQTPMMRDSYRTKAMEKMAKQKQASEGNR